MVGIIILLDSAMLEALDQRESTIHYARDSMDAQPFASGMFKEILTACCQLAIAGCISCSWPACPLNLRTSGWSGSL